MTDKNMRTLSDDDFERTLTESISKLPPADIVSAVTPWKSAMNVILFGLVVVPSDTDVIIMGIKAVLLFDGFAAVRRTNRFFRASFILSLFTVIYTAVYLLLNGIGVELRFTSAAFVIDFPKLESILEVVSEVTDIVLFVLFWLGLRQICKSHGLSFNAKPAAALAALYAVTFCIGLFRLPVTGFAAALVLIAVFLFIIYGVYRLVDGIGNFAYDIVPDFSRIGRIKRDGAIIILFAACIFVPGWVM